ncbi:SAM-dependent methyltransferase [Ruminococcus sp. OA3]|uniref:class I SAM-dependent methyltransferase n=1 Tax=Ruminococcus sp. OA3 TaxID=2914164 RepID=UPI001F06769B|nr:SAM-dependent methyltransferase [Ruminococcus sp. OA3]MCH1984442.1 SAM-dependent methyltransferase [Ruminococcus sp. OA3]
MEELEKLLMEYVNIDLNQMILSKARGKQTVSKVRIRPVLLKEELFFQMTCTEGAKELHSNCSQEDTIDAVLKWMEEQFGQLQLHARTADVTALVSKKGKLTVKCKKHTPVQQQNRNLAHNRVKDYILPAGRPVDFLVDLGVMKPDGQIVTKRYDKFRQINRFLEFIEDIIPRLDKNRELTILDFGCGKSYLTFAMYYYLHIVKQYEIQIIGLDLKADVIEHCNHLAKKYGYDKLQFYVGDIASFDRNEPVDMVVTLHACDTATDYALAKAVAWNASVILSVPCCQHELNGQIHNEILEPVLSYGILKERIAALITDGLRAGMLEEQGYETQILEFIDMEHTPKNLLIRAVKTNRPADRDKALEACMQSLHAEPTLKKLLYDQEHPGGAE